MVGFNGAIEFCLHNRERYEEKQREDRNQRTVYESSVPSQQMIYLYIRYKYKSNQRKKPEYNETFSKKK